MEPNQEHIERRMKELDKEFKVLHRELMIKVIINYILIVAAFGAAIYFLRTYFEYFLNLK
jgi:hypothetical protein